MKSKQTISDINKQVFLIINFVRIQLYPYQEDFFKYRNKKYLNCWTFCLNKKGDQTIEFHMTDNKEFESVIKCNGKTFTNLAKFEDENHYFNLPKNVAKKIVKYKQSITSLSCNLINEINRYKHGEADL